MPLSTERAVHGVAQEVDHERAGVKAMAAFRELYTLQVGIEHGRTGLIGLVGRPVCGGADCILGYRADFALLAGQEYKVHREPFAACERQALGSHLQERGVFSSLLCLWRLVIHWG